MKFDTLTIRDWKARGIHDVSCFFEKRGCAGEKLAIVEGIDPRSDDHSMSQESITFHTMRSDEDMLKNMNITHVGEKWIVRSDAINIHCGCGSSFSRKSGNPLQDKAARVRETLRQKREKAHT